MSRAKMKDTHAEIQTTHFTKCSEWWHHHWAPCIMSQGDYFKGNNIFRGWINILSPESTWMYNTFKTTDIFKQCRLTTNLKKDTFCSTVQTFIWWPFLHKHSIQQNCSSWKATGHLALQPAVWTSQVHSQTMLSDMLHLYAASSMATD